MTESKAARAVILRKVPMFADLSENELGFLAERAVPHKLEGGAVVFSEGEPCQGLHVVASGAVKVFKTSAGGREQVLTIEAPGQSVAEVPLFDG